MTLRSGILRRKVTIGIAALVIIVAIAIALVVATPPSGKVRIEEVGFRERANALEYLANVYINDELIRRIFIVVPTYNATYQPLLIHIPVVKESAVRSLRITFTPPIGRALDLAWVATTIDALLKYYRDGAKIVWQCGDMKVYGEATISLEFVPQYPRPGYFKGLTITIAMTLEYGGQRYSVVHDITID